jgi:trehalose-6-phosphate synthase
MDTGERQRRMRKLREIVKNHNIFHWVDSMLGAVDSSIPPKSHRVDDFVPDFQISSKEPGDERQQGQP